MKITSRLIFLVIFLLLPLRVTAAEIWRPMNGTGLPPLTQLNINVILADPINPKIVYLGTSADYGEYGGIYRTTDGGLTWAPFNTGLATGAGINLMAITPDGGVLYARDGNYASMGLFRTSTGSAAWTKLTTPIGSDANAIHSMHINSSYVYIGLYDIGMYKSSNQGDTWIQMEHAPINTISVIAGVSTDINLLYASVITPYKTTDGGETWEHLTSFNVGVNPCIGRGYVDTIAIDPANTDVFLVGDDNACLVRSEDGGATLSLVYAKVGVRRVVFDPRDPNRAYLSAITRGINHDGVMKSSDNGKTWVDYNSGLPWMGTSAFELGPGDAGKPSVLYAGMTRKGIYTIAPEVEVRVELTASPASPQKAGTPVNFTAKGIPEGGVYQYRFSLYDAKTGWLVKKEYSIANNWDWNPSGAKGDYQVRVEVRAAGSSADVDSTKILPYSLQGPSSLVPVLPLLLE